MATQTYNKKGDEIFPITQADGVRYTQNTTDTADQNIKNAQDALNALFYRLKQVSSQVTGLTDVEGKLGVSIEYARNSDKTTPPDSGFSDTYDSPDDAHLYTWKKTIYFWNTYDSEKEDYVPNQIGNPYYEIVATAEFPDTQFLYTTSSGNNEISIPDDDVDYSESDTIKVEKEGVTTIWHKDPQSVDESNPKAWMIKRSRTANQSWEGIEWSKPAMYGSYAFNSIPLTLYYISDTAAIPSTVVLNKESYADAISKGWVESISADDLGSGKYIYQTHAVRVNNVMIDAYNNKVWSTPTFIYKS